MFTFKEMPSIKQCIIKLLAISTQMSLGTETIFIPFSITHEWEFLQGT